jgi:NTP pyrophosphatase (non-canonical NTP hydrolase)
MQAQDRVARFCDEHDLEADPEYRILDLAAEVGEVAADAARSSGYGTEPDELAVNEDELGDALFSLLATAESLDIDAGDALETSLAKYERRLETTGDAGSEEGVGPEAGESDSAGGGGGPD